MLEYIDYLAGFFSGVVVTVIASYLQFYFSKKTLKPQFEQSEKNLRLQLLHEDRKNALSELFKIINTKYKTFSDFKEAIDSFFEGLSGAFLPKELSEALRKQINDIQTLLYEFGPPDMSDEEYEHWISEYQEQLASMSPEERANLEVEERMSGLKSNMKALIKKHLSEI